MSGIFAVLNLDGSPVDREALARGTARLSFRGPDGTATWQQGSVGLGHALLRTVDDDPGRQPATIDWATWITADARLDDQENLRNRLAAGGCTLPASVTDAELILHCYRLWGSRCVEFLRGDFAFALWDARGNTLFCARDHFGVKPFFHARAGTVLLVGNTLSCLRDHELVDNEPDELAIADFLLFEGFRDPEATAFARIRRLPPGCCLSVSASRTRQWSYWSLPDPEPLRYRRGHEYVEHFSHVLDLAVSDRLRTRQVGIELSGGLDSTAIAATAKRLLGPDGGDPSISAYTVVYDRLIPDEERRYSALASSALSLSHHVIAADDYPLFGRFSDVTAGRAEPLHDPTAAIAFDLRARASGAQRVMLTGWDGDALLSEPPGPYLSSLRAQHQWRRWLGAVLGFTARQAARHPRIWGRWALRTIWPGRETPDCFPDWVSPEFEQRHKLRDRFAAGLHPPRTGHPLRPYAHAALGLIRSTSSFFESSDPGVTRVPLEFRHPLLDLRLVEFCLSVPVYPWCFKKYLLREGMVGSLPEPVRRRPKTALAGYPHHELLRSQKVVGCLVATPDLCRYIEPGRIHEPDRALGPHHTWADLRPLSLSFWLAGSSLLEMSTGGHHEG